MKAHTVQKSLLRRIAREGKVYGVSADPGLLLKTKGRLRPQLMGVSHASTFTGFCEVHDDRLFAEIEKNPILASRFHASRLAYRAVCREVYAKEAGALLGPSRREMAAKTADPVRRGVMQEMNTSLELGLLLGLGEVQNVKDAYSRVITDDDYSDVRYCVIWFDGLPDIMCSSSVTPDFDFEGGMLQDLNDLYTPSQSLVLSLLASEDRGCAFLVWLAQADNSCVGLIRSLLRLGRQSVPHALVRFVLSNIENQFWRPDWWESIPNREQDLLMERMHIGTHPLIPILPDYLSDDGLRVVDWRVREIETNHDVLAALVDQVL